MSTKEINVQVMDGCRNDKEKLSINYSYGTYLQVGIMVCQYKLRELYRSIIYSVHICLLFTLYLAFVTSGGVRDRTASGNGIYVHDFWGVKN